MNFAEVPGHRIGGVSIGGSAPLCLIAGPCVVESQDHTIALAERIQGVAARLGVPLIFKASYDKANRTRHDSFRGPGLDEGLRALAAVKERTGLPVLTDVHEPTHAAAAAEVVDALQVPAFLCRQTDLVEACARTGKPVNLKKGQFVAPHDAAHLIDKAREGGALGISITERGFSFGYNNLVVDMRGLEVMRRWGAPVVFDATHSVQLPGAAGGTSGGDRVLAPTLARAAAAVGIDALYVEVHDNPRYAKSDGPNSLTFELFEEVVADVRAIDALVTGRGAGAAS